MLLALRRSGIDSPRRPTDLFQSLLVTSGAVTKQVDRLEAQGFVERLPDPTYQRGFLIRLTRRGVKIADSAMEAICSHQTTIGAAIGLLSEEEREIGARFLQRLLDRIRAKSAEAADEERRAAATRRSSIDEGEPVQRRARRRAASSMPRNISG